MAELKKYTSFEDLKSNEKSGNIDRLNNHIFSEFKAFLKQLRNEYSNKKNTKKDNGKQLD